MHDPEGSHYALSVFANPGLSGLSNSGGANEIATARTHQDSR